MQPRLMMILAGVMFTTAVAAQELAFTVASIKVTTQGGAKKPSVEATGPISGGVMEPPQGGRVRAQAATARALIRYAYGEVGSSGRIVRPLEPARVIGGPGWIDTTMFSVEALMDDPSRGPLDRMQMMRNLLEERFALRVTRTPRELRVYHLIFARSDRRFGPDLHELPASCTPTTDAQGREIPCAIRNSPGSLTGHGVAMDAVATYLSPLVGRIVVNRTGLTGRFDVTLKFALPAGGPAEVNGTAAADTASIFAALSEQLGLRLVAARTPVDVIVVERIERPTGD